MESFGNTSLGRKHERVYCSIGWTGRKWKEYDCERNCQEISFDLCRYGSYVSNDYLVFLGTFYFLAGRESLSKGFTRSETGYERGRFFCQWAKYFQRNTRT